ncbi:hypothetical protein NADFUDRAFT_43432 [Nadsonia fulvescens var. elongata DSM 6958]|uniref:Pre-rRNA-processing protein TSR2 n=1 Tax=Nadsonia fulvescens var. elongata DSM 6958 TaxID=857566 RepID=A0A1E3PHU7_9ASCO|nr:hypothetical protein NADFUDRAFT_43432 [Nadsonia fulvescens var. elongata DSM 6958]
MSCSFVESTNNTPLTFANEKQQARFELGICMVIYNWSNLTTAVQNQWGGGESSAKRDWLVSQVVELFEDVYVDARDIETRLLDIMEDEFTVWIEDGSGALIAESVIEIYNQCQKGDFATVDRLFTEYQEKTAKGEVKVLVNVENANPSDDESSDEEEGVPALVDEREDMDVDMDDTPAGPVIDDDGFELVQKKGGRK